MSLEAATKQKLIQDHRRHDKDSGSPEIQIAVLSKDIDELTAHMQRHPKDYASRHGLLLKVNRRNKLIAYLQRNDREKYNSLVVKLGLRK
jgi:small subunit ribosomal protein S15